jgi:hypothetical protein
MTHLVLYITTESQANLALRFILDGEIGFDTEFTERRPTREEHAILHSIPAGTNKRLALLGWQIVELTQHRTFPVAWDNVGLRLIQIARDDIAWILDMRKVRSKHAILIIKWNDGLITFSCSERTTVYSHVA